MKYEIKKHTTNADYIQKRVITTNKLNKYINKITPKIIKALNNNLNVKKDGEINKKCKDIIYNDILKNQSGYKNGINAWFDCSKYSGWLKFRTSFTSDLWSCNYIEIPIMLWNNKTEYINSEFVITETEIIKNFTPRKIKTEKQVINVINKSNLIKDKIESLNNKISELEKDFNNYLNK